jgi:hypothetical protein
MSCQIHRAMCLLLCMRLLIGRHHATVQHPKQIKFSTYDMGAYFPSIFHFIFRFVNGTWNVFATKGTYAPPQDKARGLNIHDGKWAFGPHMINKLAIQPQIKHSKATKTCQDDVKAFTHESAYMWHFQKHSYQPWIIHQDHKELSQTNHSIPNKLTKTYISFHGEQCI